MIKSLAIGASLLFIAIPKSFIFPNCTVHLRRSIKHRCHLGIKIENINNTFPLCVFRKRIPVWVRSSRFFILVFYFYINVYNYKQPKNYMLLLYEKLVHISNTNNRLSNTLIFLASIIACVPKIFFALLLFLFIIQSIFVQWLN